MSLEDIVGWRSCRRISDEGTTHRPRTGKHSVPATCPSWHERHSSEATEELATSGHRMRNDLTLQRRGTRLQPELIMSILGVITNRLHERGKAQVHHPTLRHLP